MLAAQALPGDHGHLRNAGGEGSDFLGCPEVHSVFPGGIKALTSS